MSIRLIPITETWGGRLVLALAALAAMMALQATLGASPATAITERPGDTAMTNGEVYASALSENGGTLYIGGKFNRVKETRSDGTTVGRAVSNVAAINLATGDLVRSWRPRVSGGAVRSLAVEDGVLYIGGNFTAVANETGVDQPRKNLAAVDAGTGSVMPFAPQVGGDTSYVYALEADDSRLYAGGGFSKVDGQTRKNLAAFRLATAAVDPGALDPDWTPATGTDPSCTRCSSKVRALKLGPLQSTLFVGGSFGHVTGSDGQGDRRQSVARLYTDTGDLHPWKIPDGTIDAPQTAWDLTWGDGRLFVGFGARQNYVAAFNIRPDRPGSQIWRFSPHGNTQSVALSPSGSRLFIGGHFGLNNLDKKVCNGKYMRGLASLKPETGEVFCDFLPSLDQTKRPSYEGAWTLTTTNNHLWVGGGFIGVSDSINQRSSPVTTNPEVPQTNLARFRL